MLSLSSIQNHTVEIEKGPLMFLPTAVSIALHTYNQEVSGKRVKVVTATVRIIAKVMVIITSEKIAPRASFRWSFI